MFTLTHSSWHRFVGPVVLVLALAPAATPANAEDSTSAGIEFFEKSVRPLLVKHCYECHSGKEVDGGLRLDSRAAVLKGGDTGAAVVEKSPNKSLLIEAVRYKNRDLQMPPDGALSPTEIAIFEKWVRLGLPDPRVAKSSDSKGPTGLTLEDGRDFWSFRPVQVPQVPDVKDSKWVRTPIDAFILAVLESNELTPAAVADKRTLIRRVTFNLTGLPPTPEEVDAFLADKSEDAWKKVVNRLLDSPQYGVRWGRHWLDVARYADSNGLDENLAYGNAWRYRDYVVNAFNSDKPFDRFVIEQLAGDLVPKADHETITATGFLVLGAKVLAEPDKEKLFMDTIDEQLDTLGKAFLGMTFGCVRCHDHKFDPLTQKDYYGLAAIFKSTQTFGSTQTGVIKHWHEHSIATEQELAELKKVDEKIKAKRSAASSFKSKATAKIREAARAKAADYLVASVDIRPDSSLSEVEVVAERHSLHARILHHCRLHLDYHKADSFFRRWHELHTDDPNKSRAAIESHFRPLFEQAQAAWADARKKDAKTKSLIDPQLEAARAALHDNSGFLAVPPKPEFAFDEETLTEYYRLMEEARVVESNAPDQPALMGVSDGEVHATLPVHIRGSHRNLGEPVAREFPEVMHRSDVRPVFPNKGSGRLEFARWIANSQHPLTARVFVNRLWRWHFGEGLVRSTENFGLLGDRPSHPELLDWLARHFMENGWSVKELHRLILTSSVYQMSSVHADEAAGQTVDAGNRLLWKFRIHRMEAEQLRDSILAVSGRLDRSLGGKTVPLRNRQFVFNHTSVDHTKYDSLRRAIYLPVIRNNIYTLFEQFDFPDPTMPTGNRSSTTVAPQALLLMNSDLVMDSADSFAERLLDGMTKGTTLDQRISKAYRLSFSRNPTEAELGRAKRFLASSNNNSEVWSLFCQSLFASNEFIYVR